MLLKAKMKGPKHICKDLLDGKIRKIVLGQCASNWSTC